MVLSFVLLIAGFVILVKGADFFVAGSSGLAKILHIPSIVIGLTIVAFGTSAPEAAVSIIAGINGSNGMSIGNVIGSNMFNLLGVLGISALIKPVNVDTQIVKKEFPFMIAATAVFALASFDVFFGSGSADIISRSDGLILLILMCIFLYSVITYALRSRSEGEPETEEQPSLGTGKCILFTIGGLIGIILGGQFVVDNAGTIAKGFGMSDTLVGLTIVAVGTSLPELVTSITAARKGESDIAVGNVVGSNIFNILFVLGASAAITPMAIGAQNLIDLLILSAVTVTAYIFCVTKKNINRIEGGVLTAMYAAYIAYAIVR